MTKKKIFIALLVLTIMTGGFSFALENDGIKAAVADVLRFDTLTSEGFMGGSAQEQVQEKVKRKEKVSRDDGRIFLEHEDLKNFQAVNGVVSNSMVTEQARRDIENTDMRFEDTENVEN